MNYELEKGKKENRLRSFSSNKQLRTNWSLITNSFCAAKYCFFKTMNSPVYLLFFLQSSFYSYSNEYDRPKTPKKKEHDIRHLATFLTLKLLKRKTGENCMISAGFLQRSASPQNIQCHTKASRQSQTDSWFFVVPMNSLCFGKTGGEEKNRGIEERGERETWRDRGRDEEGRKKLGSHLSERGAPNDSCSTSSPFLPLSLLPPPCLTCASFSFSSLRVRAPPGSSVTFRITTLFFSHPMNEPSVRPSTTDRKSR